MIMKHLIGKFISDGRGSMAIETAIAAPMLIIMTLGTFEVGTVVARQHELQSAANEAEIVIMATNRGATVEIDELEAIIRDSVDLPDEKITVEREYRCNLNNDKVKIKGNCPSSAYITNYVVVSMTDTYTPTWTAFGIGKPITFSVERTMLLTS